MVMVSHQQLGVGPVELMSWGNHYAEGRVSPPQDRQSKWRASREVPYDLGSDSDRQGDEWRLDRRGCEVGIHPVGLRMKAEG